MHVHGYLIPVKIQVPASESLITKMEDSTG